MEPRCEAGQRARSGPPLPRPPFAATVEKVTYRELQAVLDRLDTAVGAAEAHGCLCGALCVREGYDAPEWIADLAADAGAAAQSDRVPCRRCGAPREETLEALRSPDFTFTPLLPDDDAPLSERVAALAAWCGGFLYGIGTGAVGLPIARDGRRRRTAAGSQRTSPARELEPGRRPGSRRGRLHRAGRVRACRSAARLRGTAALRRGSRTRSGSIEQAMKKDEFARRRRQLMRMMGKDAIAILPAAPVRHPQRRCRVSLPARQRFLLPDRVRRTRGGGRAAAGPAAGRVRAVRARARSRRARPGTARAPVRRARSRAYGADDAFPIQDIDEILPGLLERCSRVFYTMGAHPEFDKRVIGWVNRLRSQAKQGMHTPHEFVALDHPLHEMRLFKSRARARHDAPRRAHRLRGAPPRACGDRRPGAWNTR